MSMAVCLARGAPFDIRGGHGSLKKKKLHPLLRLEKKEKRNGRKKFKSSGEMVIFEEKILPQ